MTSQKALSQNDLAILLFLWKWKLATGAMLKHKFFPDKAPVTAYLRLKRLQNSGYIDLKVDERGTTWVWTLRPNGLRAIQDELPPLKESGYKSENIRHDFIVNAAHLGEWLVKKPSGVELFSEQQLRRYKLSEYPAWAPQTELHRPDGYWKVPTNESTKVIALEVELSIKGQEPYRIAGEFYREFSSIQQIIWIISKESFGNRIYKAISANERADARGHSFVRLKDFAAHGWNAPIHLGHCLGETIITQLSNKSATNPQQSTNICCHFVALNRSKRSFKSDTCVHVKKTVTPASNQSVGVGKDFL